MNRFDRINLALMLTSIAIILGYQLVEMSDIRLELGDLRRMLFTRSADALKAHLGSLRPSSKEATHAEVSEPGESGNVG